MRYYTFPLFLEGLELVLLPDENNGPLHILGTLRLIESSQESGLNLGVFGDKLIRPLRDALSAEGMNINLMSTPNKDAYFIENTPELLGILESIELDLLIEDNDASQSSSDEPDADCGSDMDTTGDSTHSDSPSPLSSSRTSRTDSSSQPNSSIHTVASWPSFFNSLPVNSSDYDDVDPELADIIGSSTSIHASTSGEQRTTVSLPTPAQLQAMLAEVAQRNKQPGLTQPAVQTPPAPAANSTTRTDVVKTITHSNGNTVIVPYAIRPSSDSQQPSGIVIRDEFERHANSAFTPPARKCGR